MLKFRGGFWYNKSKYNFIHVIPGLLSLSRRANLLPHFIILGKKSFVACHHSPPTRSMSFYIISDSIFLLLGFYFFYYSRIAETFVFETTSYLGYLFREICVNNVICFLGNHLNDFFRNLPKVSSKFVWFHKCSMFAYRDFRRLSIIPNNSCKRYSNPPTTKTLNHSLTVSHQQNQPRNPIKYHENC